MMPHIYSRPYVYYFCQIFQALRLFPALRLFRRLEYSSSILDIHQEVNQIHYYWWFILQVYCCKSISIYKIRNKEQLNFLYRKLLQYSSQDCGKAKRTFTTKVGWAWIINPSPMPRHAVIEQSLYRFLT